MKVVKFSINEDYYNLFKDVCVKSDISIKRKLNVILAMDRNPTDFNDVFPSNFNEKRKPITLKVNEELYKSIMKNCGKYGLKPRKYVPYLIYKFLLLSGLTVAVPIAESDFEDADVDDLDDSNDINDSNDSEEENGDEQA